ncbi:MAG: orotate phosphoribosyltransferase [Patescibacteria group bacterium]|nr:orotate phosphoribosyltransferase [Patescibacteria group bacterium]
MEKETAKEEVAKILLTTKIVSFGVYKWQSGILAPIYCDHRELLSFPKERERIIDIFEETIKQAWPNVEVIAGVAMAGIPWAILVADRLKLPFIYIRKERKNHGKEKRIEGRLPLGIQRIGIIEDLISTGQSLMSAAIAIREETGAVNIKGGSIFTYELSEAQERFDKERIEVFSLSNITTLVKTAVKTGYLTKREAKSVEQWRDDPWGGASKKKTRYAKKYSGR